jgi:DNA-binding PadR family transcriptional regulator
MPRIDQIDRRTDVVFILFHHAKSIHGVTKLQKLLFLIEEETEFFEEYKDDLAFEFTAHKMGPFSKHVYEEIRFLQQLNAIETEPMEDKTEGEDDLTNKIFRITPKGEKIAVELANQLEPEHKQELAELTEKYNDMELRELLRYVYTEYPSFTTESEIKDEILTEAI